MSDQMPVAAKALLRRFFANPLSEVGGDNVRISFGGRPRCRSESWLLGETCLRKTGATPTMPIYERVFDEYGSPVGCGSTTKAEEPSRTTDLWPNPKDALEGAALQLCACDG